MPYYVLNLTFHIELHHFVASFLWAISDSPMPQYRLEYALTYFERQL